MKMIMTLFLLILPVSAYADWSAGAQGVPAARFSPAQGQVAQHEVHMNAPSARPAVHHAAPAVNHAQPNVRHEQQSARPKAVIKHYQAPARRMPDYFRHDVNYYGHREVLLPTEVDTDLSVPSGYEAVVVDGQTYFYEGGVFYQLIGDQLTVISPVIGAVVDSIPQDYQIVMADGVHYLVTRGIYYQRVAEGFEVVIPPVINQG